MKQEIFNLLTTLDFIANDPLSTIRCSQVSDFGSKSLPEFKEKYAHLLDEDWYYTSKPKPQAQYEHPTLCPSVNVRAILRETEAPASLVLEIHTKDNIVLYELSEFATKFTLAQLIAEAIYQISL